MRIALTRRAVFTVALGTAIPAVALAGDVPAFLVESRTVDGSVTYRFALDAGVPAAAPSTANPQPSATPFAEQTIRFATFDLDHVRLTLLDADGRDTPETIVAEHSTDGEVHPKLKAGSHWKVPVALYDRLAILADAASAPVYVGKAVTAKLQPIAGDDELDGTIVVTRGKDAHLVYDASGSMSPSSDLIGGLGFAARDGAPPKSGGPGGGRGRRGPSDQDQSHKENAAIHVDAAFHNSALQHAEGTESLTFGNGGAASTLNWSVVRDD